MHLCLFINPTGHHQAAWRHPRSQPDAGVNFGHYADLARTAETACFDAVFLADNQAVRVAEPEALGRVAQYVANFEPLTLISALAAVTSKIGLISTASTSYNFPFQLARKLASIDHISGGRVGWNVVTSGMTQESANFGREEHFGKDELYVRAAEFVDLCKTLWDSWEDDAFPRDSQSGIFSIPEKMHAANHVGTYFSSRGPLNVPRSPQGYPLFVQAGASPTGTDFAARYADMVFVSPMNIDEGRRRYSTIKGLAAQHGRDPQSIKVMPGLAVTAGPTPAQAQADFEVLQSLLHPAVALDMLRLKITIIEKFPGVDLSGYDLDKPLPLAAPDGRSYGRWAELGHTEDLTLRELAVRASGSLAGLSVCGSGEQIADTMQEWVEAGAADGFNVQPAFLPGGLDDFVQHVVPVLRERGLVRTSYQGATLREHFGLPRSPWQPPVAEAARMQLG